MGAALRNLTIDQGADWYITFTYKDGSGTAINLSGYNAGLQLRTSYDAATAALSLASGYLGVTSSTSDLINVASTTFTVTKTAAFTVGNRVRVASLANPNNYQEGAVTSLVADTSVTINVDAIGGSGTYSDWIFSSVSPGITIQPATGQILVHATATQTGAIVAGDYVYDLEITSPAGIVTRLLQGRATVSPQVTR